MVDNKAALVEKAETYVWSASRRNQRIRLSGFVPSAAMRRDILGVAKANFPGFEIVDRMALARGVPAADIWLGGISFGLTQLAGMRRGEVRLDNLTLSIVGRGGGPGRPARHPPGCQQAAQGHQDQPRPAERPRRSAPTSGRRRSRDGKFDLAGYFPDETMQAELMAAAKAVARDGAVADQMQRGSGAPADWSRATQAAVRALARLESGAAELRDATLLVSGVSADEAAAEAVRALLRTDLPASIKLTEQIRLREPRKAPVEEPPRPPEPAKPLAKAEGPAKPRQGGDACQGRDTRQSRGACQGRGAEARGAGQGRSAHQGRNTGAARAEGGGPVRAEGRRAGTPRVETKAEVVARGCQTTLTEVIQVRPDPV